MTNEQNFIVERLLSLGMESCFNERLHEVEDSTLLCKQIHNGEIRQHRFDNLMLVTSRAPEDSLFFELNSNSCTRIGDCLVPSSIADAIYAGHKFAREFEEMATDLLPKRERALVEESQLSA